MPHSVYHGSHGSFEYDPEDFAKVARIVIRLNPYMKGDDPEALAYRMLALASAEIVKKPGYISTGGFLLCSVLCEDGTLYVKPAISCVLFKD